MLQTAFTKALNVVLLQGHQNVGELRLQLIFQKDNVLVLQGHQNVGELRQKPVHIPVVKIIAGSPECW